MYNNLYQFWKYLLILVFFITSFAFYCITHNAAYHMHHTQSAPSGLSGCEMDSMARKYKISVVYGARAGAGALCHGYFWYAPHLLQHESPGGRDFPWMHRISTFGFFFHHSQYHLSSPREGYLTSRGSFLSSQRGSVQALGRANQWPAGQAVGQPTPAERAFVMKNLLCWLAS